MAGHKNTKGYARNQYDRKPFTIPNIARACPNSLLRIASARLFSRKQLGYICFFINFTPNQEAAAALEPKPGDTRHPTPKFHDNFCSDSLTQVQTEFHQVLHIREFQLPSLVEFRITVAAPHASDVCLKVKTALNDLDSFQRHPRL